MNFDQIKSLVKDYLAAIVGIGTATVMSLGIGISNKLNNGGVFNFRNPIAKTLNSELEKLNKNAKEEAEKKLKADALKELSGVPKKEDVKGTYGEKLASINPNSQIGEKSIEVFKKYISNLGEDVKTLLAGVNASSTYKAILEIKNQGVNIFKNKEALLEALQGTYDNIIKDADEKYNKSVEDFLAIEENKKNFDTKIKELKETDNKNEVNLRAYEPKKVEIGDLKLDSMFNLNDGKLTPKGNNKEVEK